MANYKDIVLSSGVEVRVYVPPSLKLSSILMRQEKYQDPPVPIVESETVTGEKLKMAIEDDPAYLAEKQRVADLRDDRLNELMVLYALKDVEIPEGWDVEGEMGEFIRFADEEWQPREGSEGRRLDYIEWELLVNPADAILIQRTISELSSIDLDEVDRTEDSFRGDVAGQADQDLDTEVAPEAGDDQ